METWCGATCEAEVDEEDENDAGCGKALCSLDDAEARAERLRGACSEEGNLGGRGGLACCCSCCCCQARKCSGVSVGSPSVEVGGEEAKANGCCCCCCWKACRLTNGSDVATVNEEEEEEKERLGKGATTEGRRGGRSTGGGVAEGDE